MQGFPTPKSEERISVNLSEYSELKKIDKLREQSVKLKGRMSSTHLHHWTCTLSQFWNPMAAKRAGSKAADSSKARCTATAELLRLPPMAMPLSCSTTSPRAQKVDAAEAVRAASIRALLMTHQPLLQFSVPGRTANYFPRRTCM